MKPNRTFAALSSLALTIAAGCGLENSLVGGRCRDGMILVDDSCVTPETPLILITPHDPTMPTTTSTAPPVPTPSATLPPPPRLPPPVKQVIQLPDASVPVPPPTTVCPPPLILCRGKCISVTSDPANCGACGKVCPSNICIDGLCQGATPGDVVVIGNDFASANPGSAQARVLVNALSIPTTDPIRVLSYEDGAYSPAVSQAKLLASAGIYGRSVSFVTAPDADALATGTLERNYDVVLIHGANGGDPSAIGAKWSTYLEDFTVRGGVVVALDRGDSPMPTLLTSSGLLTIGGHALLPVGTHLVVSDAADVVGAQVLSPYAAFGPPVTFQGVAAASIDFDWVVRATDGAGGLLDPVVVHRIVR